jgi:hypothetical protein
MMTEAVAILRLTSHVSAHLRLEGAEQYFHVKY